MFQKSAFDLLQEENCKGFHIKSFLRGFDQMLKGGIPSGIITEFCGSPGTGKTHMCLQICLHVQLVKRECGVCKAIFIDTNQGFNPNILKEMAEHLCHKLESRVNLVIDADDFLSNIEYSYCQCVQELISIISAIESKLENEENIKLIIIDSFSRIFRNFDGTIPIRTKIIHQILTELQILADKYEICVILTNEFTTKLVENNELTILPALGESYAHKIGQRIIFEKGLIQRHLHLYKTLYAPSVWIPFLINSTGIRGINTEQLSFKIKNL